MCAVDLEARIVEQWTLIYDAVYQGDGDTRGPDFVGWRSSITGENYSDAETAEWLDGTVSEILELHPTSVLEVGAGCGLVTGGLLPHLRRYVGTDIAATAVTRMSQTYADDPRVRFLVRAADDVEDLGTFDVVVLNSVIHHFPSAGYLRRALDQAVRACVPGGAVFVGDVPSLPLRELLYLCRLAAGSLGRLPALAVRDRLAAAAAHERELMVDPTFFAAFAAEHGLAADVRLKPGRRGTEMNLFRYDVRLRPRTDALICLEEVPCVPWRRASWDALLHEVTTTGLPAAVPGIPRPDLAPLVAALAVLRRLPPDAPIDLVALLTAPPAGASARASLGVVPADLVRLAAERGLACYCTPAAEPARYDAVLTAVPERGGRHTGLAIGARPSGADRPLTTSPFLQHGGPTERC
jgi:SAM-dependent methyltransferase